MPLDAETVHLITAVTTAIERHTATIDKHDHSTTTILQSMHQEQVKTNKLLDNGLSDGIRQMLEAQEEHNDDLNEYKERKKLADAGEKPRTRSNDSILMRVIKYGGGGLLLGGLSFEAWAGAFAKFFSHLAGVGQ